MSQATKQYEVKLRYANKFGSFDAELATPEMSVHGCRCRDLPDDLKFSIKEAEQIVLITENRHTQIAFDRWTAEGRACLFAHTSPSTGHVLRVKNLTYTHGIEAQQEIRNQAPCAAPYLGAAA
jgi:hypothetical protein